MIWQIAFVSYMHIPYLINLSCKKCALKVNLHRSNRYMIKIAYHSIVYKIKNKAICEGTDSKATVTPI